MTEAEREIRAFLDARRGVPDGVFLPVRLGAVRALIAEIDAHPRPAACPEFRAPSSGRDGCARCGLPRDVHLADPAVLASLVAQAQAQAMKK